MSASAIPEKKPIKFSNLLLGSALNLFEVSTLGQPLEVLKTTIAANRGDSIPQALSRAWGRGGVFGSMPRSSSNSTLLPEAMC